MQLSKLNCYFYSALEEKFRQIATQPNPKEQRDCYGLGKLY